MSNCATEDVEAVIIGAGMAGLAAADELRRAGVTFRILEARDRVGGRVATEAVDGRVIELGAQAVHTTRASTWGVIRQHGIATEPMFMGHGARTGPLGWLRSSQKRHTIRVLGELRKAYAVCNDTNVTFAGFLARAKLRQDDRALAERIATWRGAEPDQLSLDAMMQFEYGTAYQNFRVVNGYQSIPEAMARAFDGCLELGAPVTAVRWRRGGVEVDYSQGGRTSRLSARAVIVTLPLGVFQAGGVRFEPVLPAWKTSAIAGLGVGRHVIARMEFAQPFWTRELKYGSRSVDGLRILFNADTRYSEMLRADIFASTADELSRHEHGAQVEQLLAWTARAFPGVGALRTHLRNVWLWDWQRDPYARGAYSFSPVDAPRHRAFLCLPVEGTLFFAGEATAFPLHHPTVQGAYDTGVRSARELVAYLGCGGYDRSNAKMSRANEPLQVPELRPGHS